jgi:hypothetical protein
MEPKHLAFLALVAIGAVVYVLDRRMHEKAKDVCTSWNCIRCGVLLGPMQSEFIRVAGNEIATSARACNRCAKRDRIVWWGTMAFIMLALATTIYLTWAR